MSWIPLMLTVALGCGGPSHGGPPQGPGAEGVETTTVVEVSTVRLGEVSEDLVTHAVVESEAQADIFPVAAGVVLEIRRDEGDPVRRGDVLAVIENASLDAGAQRARAELSKLEGDVAQLRALHASGAVSDRELADAEHLLEAARTTAREASRNFGQTRLTAPFDGVVAVREIRVGELASSARRAFQVVDLERLRVVASLPERDVERVAIGQSARLSSAYDEAVWARGTVVRLSPVIDAQSGTFRVTIAVDPEQQQVRPGQFVSVALQVDRHEDVVVVPREAVVWEDGDPVAYRMVEAPPEEEGEEGEEAEEDWKAKLARRFAKAPEEAEEAEEDQGPAYVSERRPLELGLVDQASAEVLGGVEPGDEVIVVGQSNLRDGAPVRTVQTGEADAEDAVDRGEDQG